MQDRNHQDFQTNSKQQQLVKASAEFGRNEFQSNLIEAERQHLVVDNVDIYEQRKHS